MSLYYLDHARYPEQRQQMQDLEAAGNCIFCPKPGAVEDGKEILKMLDHWVVRRNTYPYRNTQHHFLISPTTHVTELTQVPLDERDGFWQALQWIRDTYGLTHYGLGARCGDCAATGATIAHLHIHVIVGDVTNPDHTPVGFKMSSPKPVAVPDAPA